MSSRVVEQVIRHCLLPGLGKEPVDKKSRGVRVRSLGDNAPTFGGRRQAGFRSYKCNRRPFLFPFEVAGILGCMDDLVLLIDQPVVLLNVGVKAFLGRGLINAQP